MTRRRDRLLQGFAAPKRAGTIATGTPAGKANPAGVFPGFRWRFTRGYRGITLSGFVS